MENLLRTPLHQRHVSLGARMVDFGGWEMPVQYAPGIIGEHLATRKHCGLFDVSHMGRFTFRGTQSQAYLQHVLTSNVAALDVGQAQYTMIPNAAGGAIDDAYLYRFVEDEYLLVVNASNREKDWTHLHAALSGFQHVQMTDRTDHVAMISLQGPQSRSMLASLLVSGRLPEPQRNALSVATVNSSRVMIGRTGYTGEPLGFELFVASEESVQLWDALVDRGAQPVGLGARDTLRLEAGMPLYGHELGLDPDGREIPIFACPLARYAVSFSPLKGDYIGRAALREQFEAYGRIVRGDFDNTAALPRLIQCVAVEGRAVARAGAKVLSPDASRHVGYITSGTAVPHWQIDGQGLTSHPADEHQLRSICLAYLDNHVTTGDTVLIEIRGKQARGQTVPYHLRSEAPPYARAILETATETTSPRQASADTRRKVHDLLDSAAANTRWRQSECINLIPSEMTQSPMVRLLSVMDPAFRYAEHKTVKAFNEAEVFYYQGTDFIGEIERLLEVELCRYLGASEAETRCISGQMANATVFGALVDFVNRADRKSEPRRLRKVMNNDIIKGGHLSSQPMGALKDYVAHDPLTEKAAVVNFPVQADNPYRIDVAAAAELIERHRPELIVLGKSLVLHPEPVCEIREVVDRLGLDCTVMYDMAHVLGLVGPHFQQPFTEGADLVTGSTHKTFFGTQRGVIAGNYSRTEPDYVLWETIRRRAFPGAVSNHHLGTMLGLLMAAYEMNHFRDEYQPAVLANAKALAQSLKDCGLAVAGDPTVSYTETHQVVVEVGYAKGPEIARRLEASNLIVNYQAGPSEEGFSASGCLRMGVSEMTRFGMTAADFEQLAHLIADVVLRGRCVAKEVKRFRQQFLDLRYCFSESEFDEAIQRLHALI
ncbi:MAG: glycine cleavage system aminomethyltransferase GcvT [Planctomycetes bacterium]|nr:glycine cleavage system aminomethyltransferase GcvT [Planctomycetota bacterium]